MNRLVPGIAVVVMLAGCTNQQVYDAMRGARENECREIPDAQDQDRCRELAREPYGEYERRRRDSRP